MCLNNNVENIPALNSFLKIEMILTLCEFAIEISRLSKFIHWYVFSE